MFKLDTDVVINVTDAISSLATKMADLSSNVLGYDTTCDDEFDFSESASMIAKNLNACSTKISNTANVLNNVISSHTDLQNSLKFNYTGTEESVNDSSNESNGNTSYSDFNNSNSYSGESSGNYSGVYSYVSSSEHSRSSNGIKTNLASVTSVVSLTSNTSEISNKNNNNESILNALNTEAGVGYTCLDNSKIDDDTKKIIEDKDKISNDGIYSMYDGKYLISCDSSIGKIGDIIQFTKKDGTIIKCVVAKNSSNDKINFILNKNKIRNINKSDLSKTNNLWKDVISVKNIGKIDLFKSTPSDIANNVTNWALRSTISSDSSITSLDSTNYVIKAYENAGVNISNTNEISLSNLKNSLEKNGFEWVSGNLNNSNLKIGDILVKNNNFASIYVGEGKSAGVFSNISNPNETSNIQLKSTDDYNWDGYLRYAGTPTNV